VGSREKEQCEKVQKKRKCGVFREGKEGSIVGDDQERNNEELDRE
jgi:hypothetical protein